MEIRGIVWFGGRFRFLCFVSHDGTKTRLQIGSGERGLREA